MRCEDTGQHFSETDMVETVMLKYFMYETLPIAVPQIIVPNKMSK